MKVWKVLQTTHLMTDFTSFTPDVSHQMMLTFLIFLNFTTIRN